MRRIALALAAAVLGSGCIITDTDDLGYGDVIVYWEFLRTRIAPGYPTVLYDPVDQAPTGTGACVDSGVEVMRITFPDGSFVDWDCLYAGVQGVTVQQVPEGSHTIRVTGYRDGYALYDQSQTVTAVSGGVRDVTFQLLGIPSNLAVNSVFTTPNGSPPDYAGCADAIVEEVSYSLVDWAGTVVSTGVFSCVDPNPGIDFFGPDALDRDLYAIRMQGFISPTAVDPDFDSASTLFSCAAQEFPHYADNGSWNVLLYDVTGNASICP